MKFADLGLSDFQMSLLMGPAFAVLYAVLSIPAARLAEPLVIRRVLTQGLSS